MELFRDVQTVLANPILAAVWQILMAIIAFFIARAIGKRLIKSSFSKMEAKKEGARGRTQTLEKISISVLSYTLIFLLVAFVAEAVGLPLGPLLAGAGIVGLAIGFGAQGVVSDVVTGFFLLLEKQLEVEDYVTASGIDGIVEEVGLRTTHIRGFDGTLHFIPNRNIDNVDNHSRGNMRALVDIALPADKDVEHVLSVVKEAVEGFSHPALKEGPDVLGVQSVDLYSSVVRIIARTENMQQWGVERELRALIKHALYENASQQDEDA
ncbi:mechanosensitive ion channel family protein [Shouchella shacheensis]|uniref:mechanosensitive ion channel family protein n=1 Tax=Shouchella shacheensis TaxID=1649580 RepID=UPI00074000B4|nr:mechanosensitive ion channel family protein [Shouchella shacheensis]